MGLPKGGASFKPTHGAPSMDAHSRSWPVCLMRLTRFQVKTSVAPGFSHQQNHAAMWWMDDILKPTSHMVQDFVQPQHGPGCRIIEFLPTIRGTSPQPCGSVKPSQRSSCVTIVRTLTNLFLHVRAGCKTKKRENNKQSGRVPLASLQTSSPNDRIMNYRIWHSHIPAHPSEKCPQYPQASVGGKQMLGQGPIPGPSAWSLFGGSKQLFCSFQILSGRCRNERTNCAVRSGDGKSEDTGGKSADTGGTCTEIGKHTPTLRTSLCLL